MKAQWLVLMCLATTLGTASDLTAATQGCRSPHGAVAETICGTPEYAAMDREIAALTDRAMAQFSPSDRHRLAQGQTIYLHRRQGCEWASHHSAHPGVAVDECVRTSLEGRVHALRIIVDRGRI